MYPGASDMYGDEEAGGVGSSPRPESDMISCVVLSMALAPVLFHRC